MKHVKLFEQFINEAKLEDQKIKESISEFHKLQVEIDRLKSQLKQKKAKFKEFDKLIQPVLTNLKETDDKLLETEGYLVKVKRFGYERTSSSYKAAFELLLTKVNKATQRIANEALAATEKVSTVKTSYTIDQLNEANIIQKIVRKVKGWVKKFMKIFKREIKNISEANSELNKLVNDINKTARNVKISEAVNDEIQIKPSEALDLWVKSGGVRIADGHLMMEDDEWVGVVYFELSESASDMITNKLNTSFTIGEVTLEVNQQWIAEWLGVKEYTTDVHTKSSRYDSRDGLDYLGKKDVHLAEVIDDEFGRNRQKHEKMLVKDVYDAIKSNKRGNIDNMIVKAF